MASIVTLIDDYDGVSAEALPRQFTIEDTDYEIDLCDSNYAIFLDAVAPFRDKARVIKRDTRANRAPIISKEDKIKIRDWAHANGRYIPDRGRIPNDVIRDWYATVRRQGGS